MVDQQTLISRRVELLATDIDGETVLLDITSGRYYGLARTAQRIWAFLETPISLQALCEKLSSCYDAPLEKIQSDVSIFIQKLADENIVLLETQLQTQ